MKLSFSTNGWNGFTWEDFYTMAKDLGFEGIEIHDVSNQAFQGSNGPLKQENVSKTARKMANLGLSIP
ncbi:MAG: sugar phosphate isomerase/epimerase, partial [Clostridia bacterium]|nr:sugar phosphate isomerase/epimerase [Clostridia bacterium]